MLKLIALDALLAALVAGKPTGSSLPTCSGQVASMTKISSAVTNPVFFCEQWLGSDRTNSPLGDFTPTALVAACDCIVQEAYQAVPSPSSRPGPQISGPCTCDDSYATAIRKQFSAPNDLCVYISKSTRWASPVWGLSLEQVLKGCQCILASTTHSTCATKTKTRTITKTPSTVTVVKTVIDRISVTSTATITPPPGTLTVTEAVTTTAIITQAASTIMSIVTDAPITITTTETITDTVTQAPSDVTDTLTLPQSTITVTATSTDTVTQAPSDVTDTLTLPQSTITVTSTSTDTVTQAPTTITATATDTATVDLTSTSTKTVTLAPTTITSFKTSTATVTTVSTTTVTASPAPTANLVIDGGFEDTGSSQWKFFPAGGASAGSSSSGEVVTPGQNSAHAAHLQVSGSALFQMFSYVNNAVPGTEYSISFGYMVNATVGANSECIFRMEASDSQSMSYILGPVFYSASSSSTSWTSASGQFTAQETQTQLYFALECDGTGSASALIDDVSMVAI